MQAKVGDTVRFLNTTGGGRVTRIEGQIAYVDDDGFETPILLRECVVVATCDSFYKVESKQQSKSVDTPKTPQPAKAQPPSPSQPSLPEVEETPEGEKLNIVLGFEPIDLKRLSTTTFDAYLVNDSNYYLYFSVATRANDSEEFKLRYAGLIEPSLQEFLFELTPDDLPEIDRIAFQAFAFKRDKDYAHKPVINFEQRLDATKFARLHCFVENPYFENKVLAIELVKDDVVAGRREISVDAEQVKKALQEKQREDRHAPRPVAKRSTKVSNGPLEIDLHVGELLDSTAGLSPSDILNYQVDTFRRVMDENLKNIGREIIFIHGKGEGVLRQALMKELNHRYKGHDVSDASFREYGFGATKVVIRRTR